MAIEKPFSKRVAPLLMKKPTFSSKIKDFRDKLAKSVSKTGPKVLQPTLFYGGLVAFSCGFWMIYHPLGPIIGGGLAVYLGMLMSLDE